MFPFRKTVAALVCIGWVAVALPAHANVLTNPGFESDPAGQSQTLAGWTWYGQPWGNTFNETDSAAAHSGSNYFKVFQGFTGAVNDNGVYQDTLSGPGAVYAASGWAYTSSGDKLAGQNATWIEVTFRDANARILALYRSALITTNTMSHGGFPVGAWVDLPVTNQYDPNTYRITNTTSRLVAPAGTCFVRYQIMFCGDANGSTGSAYFDDLNLSRTTGAPYGNWNIVWSDEFNGDSLNTNVWTFDTGNRGGWGNHELEYYTARPQNVFVRNGALHIVARQEPYGGEDYTSARLKTQGLFSTRYGRLEWRAKLPAGLGFWPALWLLGTNITSVGWPACGEIDVMENRGGALTNVQGSLHSRSDETAVYTLPQGASVTSFHTYTLDWTTNSILWYVDGHLYERRTNWSSSLGSYPAPFDRPFFLIMNLAIGGDFVGNPTTNAINANSHFPGDMEVDYVRLYRPTAPLHLSITRTNSEALLTWPTNVVCRLQERTDLSDSGWTSNWTNVGPTGPGRWLAPVSGNAFYRLASP